MVSFVCNLRDFECSRLIFFREHARIYHGNDLLLCPVSGCFAQFKKYDTFRKHCEPVHVELNNENGQESNINCNHEHNSGNELVFSNQMLLCTNYTAVLKALAALM